MKKTIVQINTVNYGSTGNIMLNISKTAEREGYISYVAYANSRSNKKKKVNNSISIGSIIERNLHLKLAYYTGLNGCFSYFSTKRFLNKLDKIKPNLIHLHNLHNCYINLKLLFKYIKRNNIPVVWTLHDCWSFTGQCAHFTVIKCDKWKSGCYDCPQYKKYPASRIDNVKKMYNLKKKWFTEVNNLKIVTPSYWLANLIKESYLKNYEIKVINNGIDLRIFKPIRNNFKEKYNLQNKYIILGIANPWSEYKGFSTFIELSKILDKNFKIVLVGLSKEQIQKLPNNILGLPKTNNINELAKIYSAGNVFFNPSLQENFPTTNIEAIACGTPVITYNSGGSVEAINKYTGRVVENNSLGNSLSKINSLIEEGKEKYIKERLREAEKYNVDDKFKEYTDLYNTL